MVGPCAEEPLVTGLIPIHGRFFLELVDITSCHNFMDIVSCIMKATFLI